MRGDHAAFRGPGAIANGATVRDAIIPGLEQFGLDAGRAWRERAPS